MSGLTRNSLKITAVLIFLAGFPAAFLIVAQGASVMAGIAAGFALLALFLWFLSARNRNAQKTASIIILAGGLVSGFLIGYRVGWSPAPPWSWDKGCYFQVVVGPYMDWIAALIPWAVFIILGLILFQFSKNRKIPL